jgi:hypothetical protein
MAEGLERIRTQDEKENNEIPERINAARGFCGKGSCAIVLGKGTTIRSCSAGGSDQGIECGVGVVGEFGKVEEEILVGGRLRPWTIC